jgi:predicted nucleic acid-binding protein
VSKTTEILPSLSTLERLSAFVLNRATDDFRSELYEYLVMMALHDDKEDKGMTENAIASSIEQDLTVRNLPINPVQSALRKLQDKGSVKRVRGKGGDLYLLSHDERTRIRIMTEQYSKTATTVKMALSQKVKEQGILLDMNQEAIVFATFRNFLATVLSELGTECCLELIGSGGKTTDSLKPTNVTDILDNVLGTVEDSKLRKAERQAFIEFISNPDETLSDFLYSLAQSYFFIQILHVDPECQSLTKASLQRKRVYLDTNIIHCALFGVDRRDKAVDDALKLTATLGIVSVLSERTKREFFALVEKRKRGFGESPRIPKKRFKKVARQLENGLLKDFHQKKSKNPNLTFDRYVDRLEEVDAILKNRYSTISDDNEYQEILKNPDLPQLCDIVTREGTSFGLMKTPEVAEHDAFHILLVQELRKEDEGDILGPNYWFLTHDRSLLFVEKRFGKYERFPSSVFIDNWVQLISPLLSPEHTKNARDAYVSLFSSRLPILTRAIDEEVFLAFQGKWMDDEDLTPQDIARVIGNRYIKDYYKRSKQEEMPISDEDKQKMLEPIIEEIKTQRRETTWIRREFKELQKTTEALKKEVGQWKELSKTQRSILSKLGHILGAFLFIILWYVFYEFFVGVHSVEHLTAFACSVILAASFGALADFFGYRWLLDRFLRFTGPQKKENQ